MSTAKQVRTSNIISLFAWWVFLEVHSVFSLIKCLEHKQILSAAMDDVCGDTPNTAVPHTNKMEYHTTGLYYVSNLQRQV